MKFFIILPSLLLFFNLPLADFITFPGQVIMERMEQLKVEARQQCGLELTKQELKDNLVMVVNNCETPEGATLILEQREDVLCTIRC